MIGMGNQKNIIILDENEAMLCDIGSQNPCGPLSPKAKHTNYTARHVMHNWRHNKT